MRTLRCAARVASLAALACIFASQTFAQIVTTYPCRQYALSKKPLTIKAGNLNGDTLPDLVVASQVTSTTPQTTTVLLARCEGGYFPPVDYPTSSSSFDVALGDMDDDGDLDIVATELVPGAVIVRFNDGAGGFASSSSVSVGAGLLPTGVAVGDVDADGWLDVVANCTTGKLVVLLNDGAGGLVLDTTIAHSIGSTGWVALEDFDADGWLDCVATGTGASIVFLLGSSSGFGVPATLALPALSFTPWEMDTGDYDGDGDVDALFASDSQIAVMVNDGTGVFSTATLLALGIGSDIQSVALGDLDGDSVQDVLAGQTDRQSVAFLRGLGSGAFAPPVWTPVGAQPISLALADLDDDGTLDVAASAVAHAVSVSLNQGGGVLCAPGSQPAGAQSADLVLADVDSDTLLDLVVSNITDGALWARLGDGTGAFPVGVTSAVGSPARIVVFDVTGDGDPDVVGSRPITDSDPSGVLLFPGDGAGGFAAATLFATAPGCTDLVAGDIDLDGDLDVVALNRAADSVSVLLGAAGSFLPAVTFAVLPDPVGIALGQLNPGAVPDLLILGETPPSVELRIGDGAGGFGLPTLSPLPAPGTAITLGDVTGDGLGDAVVSSQTTHAVFVLPGTGLGGLGAAVSHAVGQMPGPVRIFDMDANGTKDILTVNRMCSVTVLVGTGGGQFLPQADFTTGWFANAMDVGDLDGNGLPDVVTANEAPASDMQPLSVLLNEPIVFCNWTSECTGLAGIAGIPLLVGAGSLETGTPGSLTLTSAAPSAQSLLFVALASNPTPFKCGLLCPQPAFLVLGIGTSRGGSIPIQWSSWPAVSSGVSLYFQYAVQDAAAICGVSLSNSLRADVP